MRYYSIDNFEVCNGEGVGCSLFVQGCHFHCKNCFNKETWDFDGGKEWTPNIENEFLNLIKRPYIKRVSILGGEPLADENILTVYELLRKIPENKKIWVYTGRTFEDLILDSFGRLIITRCDVLVDGKYIDELKDLSLPFRGSSNQRLIDVKNTLKKEKIVLWN